MKHAPANYRCPFCAVAAGEEHEAVLTKQQDVVYRNKYVVAFVASHGWPNNKGHVLVVPIRHFENLYEIPDEIGAQVFSVSRRIALALKHGYGCDGVSTRQHNEPAGHQEIWHYHLHVFPRYTDDMLYTVSAGQKQLVPPEERREFAVKICRAMDSIA